MSTSTQIEWTDATWNPVTGCSKITRGCDFCYAERFSERFRGVAGHPFENGFDLTLRPERLTQPLSWRQPRRVKSSGNFDFVVSTKIDRSTAERPHFFIAYATKSDDGLKVFRQTEYEALREHVKNRASAKERQREQKTGTPDMFANHETEVQEATIDELVEEQKALAAESLINSLQKAGPLLFSRVVADLLQTHMLRETNVKDICVDLAKSGRIENTWGDGNRKPRDSDIIRLRGVP